MKAVNLLPPDLRSSGKSPAPAVAAGAPETGGPGAFIVLGALALCVVALAGYVLTTNLVNDRQTKLADVTAKAETTTRQAAALKPYADFETLANARIATVNDLATQRFDWEQSLRDLSRVLPGDVTLSQLSGTVSSQTGSGGGASPMRGAIDAPAIELQGCTAGQTDVAQLMSRLRNVDGVTRVSLSKSDKETPTTRSMTQEQSAGNDLGDANACGRGTNKPSFDLIMFFENDAEASVDPAGTGDAAAAAATPEPDKGDAGAAKPDGAASGANPTATGLEGQSK